MKKILALCLSLALLAGMCTLFVSAETETDTTIKYGKADLALTIIDPFDETQSIPGFNDWGTGTMANGGLFMESGTLYDSYRITTEALLANPTLGGHTHIALAIVNDGDGAACFGFQPHVRVGDTADDLYFSRAFAEANPIKLVWKNGKVEDAKFYEAQSWGRYAISIPYEFDGFVIIPHAALSNNTDGTGTVTTDGTLEYTGLGFHFTPDADDAASYVEVTISAVYACSELPAYEAPDPAPETAAPTVPETAAPTDPETAAPTDPETDPATEPETDAATDPETQSGAVDSESAESATGAPADSETGAGTTAETDPAEGCASVIGASAVLLLAVAAGAVIGRKKD